MITKYYSFSCDGDYEASIADCHVATDPIDSVTLDQAWAVAEDLGWKQEVLSINELACHLCPACWAARQEREESDGSVVD